MSGLSGKEHMGIWPRELAGQADNLFKAVIRKLAKHDIPYFVTGGTLLGLVRDGELIDSDTDIDFSVDGSNVTEEQVLAAFDDWPLAREVRWDDVIQQLVWYPHEFVVDAHFYRLNEEGRYACRHIAGTLVFPGNTFTDHEILETRFGPVRIPKKPVKYLASKYGQDWRTPKYQAKGKYA